MGYGPGPLRVPEGVYSSLWKAAVIIRETDGWNACREVESCSYRFGYRGTSSMLIHAPSLPWNRPPERKKTAAPFRKRRPV